MLALLLLACSATPDGGGAASDGSAVTTGDAVSSPPDAEGAEETDDGGVLDAGDAGGDGGSVDAAAEAAAEAGAGTCTSAMAQCQFIQDTEVDKQSSRQRAGYMCAPPGYGFVGTEDCDFTETCQIHDDVAACVSCGAEGARFARRVVDGQLVDDAKGCRGSGGWAVYDCYSETTTYGASWVDVVWQRGFDVMRFALLTTGEMVPNPSPKQLSNLQVSVNNLQIQPNGLVDFGIGIDVVAPDNLQQTHVWRMDARVVGRCK